LTRRSPSPKSRAKAISISIIGETVKIRAYGKLADLFGQEDDVDIDVPCTVADLRARLAATYPDAAEPLASKRVLTCVGNTIVPDDHILGGGEQVELLAPVSGG
jgi:molybdopterin converting factor small subunit